MGDRFFEDLGIARSSNSIQDDYYSEEDTYERYEGEEDDYLGIDRKSEELACPFCSEDFDVLGLCCHIDADHRAEVKPRICPVCATKVGINMASHLITQHESILRALCNKKHRGTRSGSSISLSRKDMQEKHLQCIKESPSAAGPSSDSAPDTMLLSFVKNSQPVSRTQIVGEASSKSDASLSQPCSSTDDYLESKPQSQSTERSDERTRKCDFIQGLMISTILDDL